MTAADSNQALTSLGPQQFTETHWSVVLMAGGAASPQATHALEQLCRVYWYPLYAYVRRQGYDAENARDLTQGFFARLLEKNYLGQADREKGKFRSFLLGSLRHFLADERDRLDAAKRGGGTTFISLDNESAEARYRLEPADEMSPEKIFERRWALTVLEQARSRLREEYFAAGKTEFYEQINVFESGGKGPLTYVEIAVQLGTTESAVKSAAHRLRQRYRELVREEITHTVASPAEVDEEIRYLIAVISR